MREKCARVLAAALMTGAIGFALAMPAFVGTGHDAGQSLTAPPSFLQRSVQVVASGPPLSASTGRLDNSNPLFPGAFVPIGRSASAADRGNLASSRHSDRADGLKSPRPAPKPAAPKPATPPPTPTPTPVPAPAPAPAADTRGLATPATPPAPAAPAAPTASRPTESGKGKGEDKGKGKGHDKNKDKDKDKGSEPTQTTAPPPAATPQPAVESPPTEGDSEHGGGKDKGKGKGKGNDKGND